MNSHILRFIEEKEQRQAKEASPAGLGEWAHQWSQCERCPLHSCREKVVLGEGDSPAPVLLVGGVPSREADRSGSPFSGLSTELLARALRKESKGRSWFYVNVLACRTPGGRGPEAGEMIRCLPRLDLTVRAVRPWVVVLLGEEAALHTSGPQNPLHWDRHSLPCVMAPDPGKISTPQEMKELRSALRRAFDLADRHQDTLF